MIQGIVTAIKIIIDLIQAIGVFMIGLSLLAALGCAINAIDSLENATIMPIKIEMKHSVAKPKFRNPFKK